MTIGKLMFLDATNAANTYMGHRMLSSIAVRITRAEAYGSLGLLFPFVLFDVDNVSSMRDRLRLADVTFIIWLARLKVVVAKETGERWLGHGE